MSGSRPVIQKVGLIHRPMASMFLLLVSAHPWMHCMESDTKQDKEWCGIATYRERIALPKDSRLRLEIVDVTDGKVVNSRTMNPTAGKQVPLKFCISLPASAFAQHHSYNLRAGICVRGEQWFSNGTGTAISVYRKQKVHLLLRRTTEKTACSP